MLLGLFDCIVSDLIIHLAVSKGAASFSLTVGSNSGIVCEVAASAVTKTSTDCWCFFSHLSWRSSKGVASSSYEIRYQNNLIVKQNIR